MVSFEKVELSTHSDFHGYGICISLIIGTDQCDRFLTCRCIFVCKFCHLGTIPISQIPMKLGGMLRAIAKVYCTMCCTASVLNGIIEAGNGQ